MQSGLLTADPGFVGVAPGSGVITWPPWNYYKTNQQLNKKLSCHREHSASANLITAAYSPIDSRW